HVDDILVLWVDLDLCEVEAAAPQPPLAVDALPALAGVIRAVDAAVARGIDDGVQPLRIARGDGDADAAEFLLGGGQSLGERPPGVAAVGGLVQPAALSLPGAVLPRPLPRFPQDGVDGPGVGGVEGQGGGSRIVVLGEHLLPGLAAVGGAVD